VSKFLVTVARTSIREHAFTVEATSASEARDKAYDEACNHDFWEDPESDSCREITSTVELQEAAKEPSNAPPAP